MGENLKKFKQKFEIFLIAANIEEKNEKKERKVTILLNVLGDEALTFIMHRRIYQQIRLRQ